MADPNPTNTPTNIPTEVLKPIACTKVEISLAKTEDFAIWDDALRFGEENAWGQICIGAGAIEILEAVHPIGKSLLALLDLVKESGYEFLILELDKPSQNKRAAASVRAWEEA